MFASPDIIPGFYAASFAAKAHYGQTYGGEPYTFHLQNVYTVLREFGYASRKWMTVAWLHDVVEDTTVTIQDVRHTFGDEIADIVYAVTSEPGRNRKERWIKTAPKIINNNDALILKLADRISNVRFSRTSKSSLFEMYQKEHPEFRKSLYQEGIAENMWATLDNLINVG